MAWWMWAQIAFDVAVIVWILRTNAWTHDFSDALHTFVRREIDDLKRLL